VEESIALTVFVSSRRERSDPRLSLALVPAVLNKIGRGL